MKDGYSQELVRKFQEIYQKKFGEDVSWEEANIELNYLARLVESAFVGREYVLYEEAKR